MGFGGNFTAELQGAGRGGPSRALEEGQEGTPEPARVMERTNCRELGWVLEGKGTHMGGEASTQA